MNLSLHFCFGGPNHQFHLYFIIIICHENMFLCLHYNLDRRRTCRRIALNHKLHKDPWDQCNHQQLNHSQVVQLCLLQPERKRKYLTHIFPQTRTILSFFYIRYRCIANTSSLTSWPRISWLLRATRSATPSSAKVTKPKPRWPLLFGSCSAIGKVETTNILLYAKQWKS